MTQNNTDALNHGYLSHNILYRFYRVIDFIGNRLIKRKPLQLINNKLLFINLGLIGDLILFRYVIDDFLKLNYTITLLIRAEYKFLFTDIANVKIITVAGFKEKKILSGLVKITNAIRQSGEKYALSCHFRAYLGTGILSTFISGMAHNSIGYPTAGFGFLLNKKLAWQANVHETVHLINVLQALEPEYKSININAYANYTDKGVLEKFNLLKGEYIVIHPTSQNSIKNIPKLILQNTLSYILNNSQLKIVFVGTLDEAIYVKNCLEGIDSQRIIITNGETGLFDVRYLVANALFFIGVDSSIAHLAAPLQLPKIILWHHLNSLTQWHPLGCDFFIINEKSDQLTNDLIVNKIKQLGLL